MRVFVILNKRSGSNLSESFQQRISSLQSQFAALGVDAEIRGVDGGKLQQQIQSAIESGVDALLRSPFS